MSSTVKLGGTTTGTLASTIDTTSNSKTSINHGLNLASHLNSQHLLPSSVQEVLINSNSAGHTIAAPLNSNACPVVKPTIDSKIVGDKAPVDNNIGMENINIEPKTNIENKINADNKVMDESKQILSELATNCTVEKPQPVVETKSQVVDEKKLVPSIAKVNNSVKIDGVNADGENKIDEPASLIKNNVNNDPVITTNQTKAEVDTDSSTKVPEAENKVSVEPISVKTKEPESPKSPTTVNPNNNVTSTVSSPVSISTEVTTTQITSTPPAENRFIAKPASTMKLATVSRTHIKRKRDLKMSVNSTQDSLEGSDTEVSEESPQKSKRARVKTQPYQSPLPEFALITKLSASMAKSKTSDDKLIIFYKNEFLAVRNSEGGFFICQAMQNVYKSSPKIRILWLSQDENDSTGETYSPDFYDFIDFDCILTNLNLNRMDKRLYKLPPAELERTKSILQRALNVEQGICSNLDITEEHPDGLDLSLYRDEAQLDNKKKKAAKAKRKAELLEAKLAKKHLHAINKKSKKIKKSHKKRKVNSAAIVKATKSKIASKRASPNKKESYAPVKSVASSSRSRTAAIVPVASTSKAKNSTSKRKAQESTRAAATQSAKVRSSGRNATVPVATTSRSTRTAKLTKDKRGQK